MTHRGPFQPLPFCDSVMCKELVLDGECKLFHSHSLTGDSVHVEISQYKQIK